MGAGGDPDLAGMGSDCTLRNNHACLQDGRLDTGNGGCTITSPSITGVVCCRADYQTLAFDTGMATSTLGFDPVLTPCWPLTSQPARAVCCTLLRDPCIGCLLVLAILML